MLSNNACTQLKLDFSQAAGSSRNDLQCCDKSSSDQVKNDKAKTVETLLNTVSINKDTALQFVELLIEDIEDLFGPKTNLGSYKFGGIFFRSTYPHMAWDAKKHQYKIRLSANSRNWPASAFWQLAHECVHILCPGSHYTTTLEEGLACWYQTRWTKKLPEIFPMPYWSVERLLQRCASSREYYEPYLLVNQLLLEAPDSIKQLRKTYPNFSQVTAKQLRKEIPALDAETAKSLCQTFSRFVK